MVPYVYVWILSVVILVLVVVLTAGAVRWYSQYMQLKHLAREQTRATNRLARKYMEAFQALVQINIERYMYEFDVVINKEEDSPAANQALLNVIVIIRARVKNIADETRAKVKEIEGVKLDNPNGTKLQLGRMLTALQAHLEQTVEYISDAAWQPATDKLPAARKANVWRGHLQQKLRQAGMDALRVVIETQTEQGELPAIGSFLPGLEEAMERELESALKAYRGPKGQQPPQ